MTTRYIAVDNTSALGGYAGWELVDTHAIPERTFAIAMPEEDAKRAALALNSHDELVALLRETRGLTFGLYTGTAYIRRAYQDQQDELAKRVDALLAKVQP